MSFRDRRYPKNNLMESLFALLDHALLVKEVLGQLLLEVRDLLTVQRYAAALHQLARLAVGGCKAALDEQRQHADLAVGKVRVGQRGGRHVGSRTAGKRRSPWQRSVPFRPPPCRVPERSARMRGFPLRWFSCAPSQLSIASISSSGRKVSIRMHLSTSASSTLRQYW